MHVCMYAVHAYLQVHSPAGRRKSVLLSIESPSVHYYYFSRRRSSGERLDFAVFHTSIHCGLCWYRAST